MGWFRVLLAVVAVLVPLNLYAAEQGFARLSLIEGDVQVRVAESDDWVPAAANTPLYEGDSIWAPKGSRTEIQLRDGSVIRLDARTALNVLKVESDFLQFNLGMGRAYVRTGSNRQWSMQFDLDESSVKVEEKGRFRLDIHENGDEEISVFRGSAYVESYGNRTRVRTGEMLSLEDSRSEIAPINPQDSWDRWNSDRDAHLARRSGAGDSRLPGELVVYEEELSASGEWVVTRDYGQVWRPTVVAIPDWAPYREGRWIWRGGEYVWVSYEPWGWAPYHYGRWTIVPGFGWCWVPPLPGDVYWAPGYVGWISTPSYVGWVPLAPGEVYYGRGYYGRNSVNVTNVTNITVVNNITVYKNSRQRNALTAVDRDGFVSGKGRYSRRSLDAFKKEKVVVGRPEPRQGAKEVFMPRVRKVAADKQPPPIAKLPVGELKRKFPKLDHGGSGRQPQRDGGSFPVGGRQGRGDDGHADKGKNGRSRGETPPFAGPGDTGEVKTKNQHREGEKPGRGDDRRARFPEEKNGTAGDVKSPGIVTPGQRQNQSADEDVPSRGGDRSGRVKKGGDRVEPQANRDGGRKDGSAPGRKAKGVWKIKQKEEAPREKEKK